MSCACAGDGDARSVPGMTGLRGAGQGVLRGRSGGFVAQVASFCVADGTFLRFRSAFFGGH